MVLVAVVAAGLIWRTPEAAIIATVVAAAVMLAPAGRLIFRAACSSGPVRPKLRAMGSQIRFGVPLGLSYMVGTVTACLDKAIVSDMCTLQQAAIYFNGAVELPLIGIVSGAVGAVLLPEVTRACAEGRQAEALQLWKRAAQKCAVVLIPVMFGCLALAPDVMTVLFSPKYRASYVPFCFYLSLIPMRVVVWSTLFIAVGRTRLLLVQAVVGLVVNATLSIVLVHVMGYLGAVVGTVATFYLWNVPFCLGAVSRSWKVRAVDVLPLKALAKIAAVSAISCAAMAPAWLLGGTDGWSSLGRLAIGGALYVPVVAFGLMKFAGVSGKSIRAMVRESFSRLARPARDDSPDRRSIE